MINPTMIPLDGDTIADPFTDDRPGRYMSPVPNVPGKSVHERAELDRLRKVLSAVTVDGFTPSADVVNALAVAEAINSYKISSPAPVITGMTPAQATTALDEYITVKARQSVAENARALVLSAAITDLDAAVRADTNRVIDYYRARYSESAGIYAEAHPLISRFENVAQAATDETGESVVMWHEARRAANEAERIVGVIMGFAYDKPHSEDYFDQAVSLMADPGTMNSVVPISNAMPELKVGVVTPGAHFGRLPLLVASGATLSLPASREEWRDRTTDYRIQWDTYMSGFFRDDDE